MGQDDSGDDERRARYAALSSQPVRKPRPTCAICMVPVEEFYECEDAGLDRVIFIAVCHGARERVVVEGNLTVRDLGLAFVPEGPPALPAPPTHALPPHEEDLRDRPAASFCSEGPYREEDGTLSPYERCGAEYWYPSSFGMTLPWKGRCERRKGHASGPAPRYGHSGAEKT